MAASKGSLLLLHAFLCSIALVMCGYALYVERMKEADKAFRALCDIKSQMTCSAVLTSRYSKGFGVIGDLLGDDHILNINNSVYGIAFYLMDALLVCCISRHVLSLLVAVEIIGALNFVYLGYIMFVVLKDICVVCFTLYSIHFSLLLLHMYQWYSLHQNKKKKLL